MAVTRQSLGVDTKLPGQSRDVMAVTRQSLGVDITLPAQSRGVMAVTRCVFQTTSHYKLQKQPLVPFTVP